MHDRSALGAADVDDATLAGMVADLLGLPEVEPTGSRVEPVAHDLPSITTVGRWWVSGTARTPAGEQPWRIFVKQVQAWHHSSFFAQVPAQARELAAAGVPWRTEAAVYRSDLADRLPDGLAMPRALMVVDLDPADVPDSWVVWLDDVSRPEVRWDTHRYARAAYLLGRLAASPAVAPLADIGGFPWSTEAFVEGRLRPQVLPALADEALWAHPAVAATDPTLRGRLLAAGERVEAFADELDALPRLTAHGVACPENLLAGSDPDGFVLLDFGFWMPEPVGFDLTQLLVGDVQLGRRPADGLGVLDDACVRAYAEGLAAEGLDVPVAQVRRAHALAQLLYAGLPSLLVDPPGAAPEVLVPLYAERAALARHCLDLLERTS